MNWINKIASASVIASFMFVSCEEKSKSDANFHLEVDLEDVSEVVISKITPEVLVPMDTLNIEDGAIRWENKVEEPDFYIVNIGNQAISLLVTAGEDVRIEGTLNDSVKDYTIEGSKGSNELQEMSEIATETETQIMALNDILIQYQDSANFVDIRAELVDQYMGLIERHSQKMEDYIDNHPASLSNIVGLFQSVAGQPALNIDNDFLLFEKVRNQLIEEYPNNEHVIYLDELVNEHKSVAIGSPAPDFILPNTDGVEVSLSDFRGNYLLVDFWASWCRPCRSENPNIVAAYEKYQEAGFQILGVSLDGVPQQTEPKTDWLAAIELDNLSWTQLSDLKGWSSPLQQLYKFQGIPHSVLLDEDGKIVAKNLRGESLHSKLAEIYGF